MREYGGIVIPPSKASLEDAAEQSVRLAVREVLGLGVVLHPPDAGMVARVREAVRLAWAGGREEAALEIAEAYRLSIENDDPDVLRGAIAERVPFGTAEERNTT